MSHFTVGVITKGKPTIEDIDKALAPYSESIDVEVFTSKEDIIKKEKQEIQKYKESIYAEFLADPIKYKERYPNPVHLNYIENEFPKKLEWTDEEIYQDAIKYEDSENIMEDGSIRSTYNPNSKWDWYQIGGRWAGSIKVLKDSVSGKEMTRGASSLIHGMNGGFDNYTTVDSEVVCVDSARIKDIIQRDTANIEKLKRKWELIVEKQDPINEDEQKILEFNLYKPEYFVEKYGTKERYIDLESQFTTYAVLDKNGVWHESGQMGWFGVTSASPDEEVAFKENYKKFVFDNAEEDDWLTVVDCHI